MNFLQHMRVLVPYLMLLFLFVAHLYILWPGYMTPDSHIQYQMALTGQYNDHHPPMMSVIWGMLDGCLKGSGLLFALHLAMLYVACALFMSCFYASKLKWLYLILPLFPPVFLYSGMLWKDVSFACSYLLAGAIISYLCVYKQQPIVGYAAAVCMLLFYGTAVKFQAQYVVPWMLFGLSVCFTSYKIVKKTMLITVISSIAMLSGIYMFNNYFVGQNNKSYSWQWVKLYDLAGITFYTGDNVLPSFIIEHPEFSLDELKKRFNHQEVDSLQRQPHNPLRWAVDQEQRQQIIDCWYKAVVRYPHIYLYHRAKNFMTLLTSMPLQQLHTLDFSKYSQLSWLSTLQKLNEQKTMDTWQAHCKSVVAWALFALLAALRSLFMVGLLVPFIIAYFVIGWLNRGNPAALPLLLFNGVNILLLLVLFFFSMASVMRYVYIVVCLVHASHAFAYACVHEAVRSWMATVKLIGLKPLMRRVT